MIASVEASPCSTPVIVTDVVVCGSGAAGLAAALAAATAGVKVILLERTALLGGTSAMSSGLVYAPGSTKMDERDVPEDIDAAVNYMAEVARAGFDSARARTFATSARRVIADLEAAGVRFRPTGLADFYPAVTGASVSRAIALEPFDSDQLEEWVSRVRRSPYRALETNGAWSGGTALIAYLIKACLAVDVDIWTESRAEQLVVDGEVIRGVHVRTAQGTAVVRARGGVILATGGYEYDVELLQRYLPEIEGAWSCPGNAGDGLRLAESAGASLASMDSAQWYALVKVRDEEFEGTPRFDDCAPARCLPGSIIVDSAGLRFVNEGANFNDVGRAVAQNTDRPAWLVVDKTFAERYGRRCYGDAGPGTAGWASADSVASLAEQIGIDATQLTQTVKQFNADAGQHVDTIFGRGASGFDQSWGDSEQTGPAACLAPLSTAPFSATRVYAGLSGTSGGPQTDSSARVVRPDGTPVTGLWAAGNAMASFLGDGSPGSGSTLGPGLVFGTLAGQDAAARVKGSVS